MNKWLDVFSSKQQIRSNISNIAINNIDNNKKYIQQTASTTMTTYDESIHPAWIRPKTKTEKEPNHFLPKNTPEQNNQTTNQPAIVVVRASSSSAETTLTAARNNKNNYDNYNNISININIKINIM